MISPPANQPHPPNPDHPRYTTRPFPSYRFVPGLSPHPRRDPRGHSYGQPEPSPSPIDPARWRESQTYLYGIDLFNFAYWWECHEELESLWHAAGHDTEVGLFLQGIVQIAAANLRRFMQPDNPESGQSLMHKGLDKLRGFSGIFMGVDVAPFRAATEEYFNGQADKPPTIALIDSADDDPHLWGLCASCIHARTIASSHGSEFMQCQLSFTDQRFAKYPRTPVRECVGHEDSENRTN